LFKGRIIAHTTERTPTFNRLERSDGSVLEWASVPLPDGATLMTYLDVTDSNNIERALRERGDALEEADRLKSEFIANVSYELRTPLNTIIGFSELLSTGFFGELEPRQAEYVRGIFDSSQHLLQLVNDILDLATGGTVTLGATRDADSVSITVIDTGIGITIEDQSHIFDKFWRRDSAPLQQTGTGLGLPLVKSFVDLHGGRLDVESNPETGTRITCVLPVNAHQVA